MRTFLLNFYDEFSVYLNSFEWQRTILFCKIISLIISILLFIAVVYLIFRIRKNLAKSLEMLIESVSAPGLPKKAMAKQWKAVLSKLEKDDESSYRLAVIEADKIFDDILKRIGYQGADMGERLKRITPAQMSNIDEVWQAHKVRNQIVHEPDFRLTRSQAKRAVEIFQRALEDLEAI